MNDLNEIRMAIEALPTTSHYEIFNIINKHNISFTENSNGILNQIICPKCKSNEVNVSEGLCWD